MRSAKTAALPSMCSAMATAAPLSETIIMPRMSSSDVRTSPRAMCSGRSSVLAAACEIVIFASGGSSWMPKRHVIIFVMLAG